MKHTPIEIVIGWKATFGWLDYAAQAWVANPKPKRRLLHVDMGWVPFGAFEQALATNALPFNKLDILADANLNAYRRFADMTIMVGVYAPPWRRS